MEEVDLIFLLRGEKEWSGEGLVILNTELDVELLLAVLGSDLFSWIWKSCQIHMQYIPG